MKKITMKNSTGDASIMQMFERFITASLAKGISERTIKTYRSHFKCLSHHLDIEMPFNSLSNDIVNKMIVSMRESGLAHNSISSYTRVMRTFFNWCSMERYIKVYENAAELLERFEQVKELAAAQTNSYLFVKNWFVLQFPNYKILPDFTSVKLIAKVIPMPTAKEEKQAV